MPVVLSWVLKILAAIAAVAFLTFEIGSPVVIRLQLGDVAVEAAADAASVAVRGGSLEQARDAALAVTSRHAANLDTFTVHSDRTVSLILTKRAPSYLLAHIGPIKGWWRVEVAATAIEAPSR